MKKQLFQRHEIAGLEAQAEQGLRPARASQNPFGGSAANRRGGRWPRRGLIAGALALAVSGCGSDAPKPPAAPPPAAAAATSPSPPSAAASPATNAAPAIVLPSAPALSPGVAEIIQMAQAGVGEKILIEYAQDSPVAYDLTSAEVVYLKDLGISDAVIEAMLARGRELRARQPENQDARAKPSAPAKPETHAAARAAETAPAPSPAKSVYDQPVAAPPPAEPPPPAGGGTVTPPTSVTNNYFYSALAPYGSWLWISDYGWCWRPTVTVVNPDWRPYCDNGGWVYTNAGYYWQSYYSWGWAPFHYGRWCLTPAWGWVWRPGCVWGPAWVTWRACDGYYGWAPLPPACGWSAGVGLTWHGSGVSVSFGFGLSSSCYTFVPVHYFCHPHVGYYGVAGPRVVNIYQGSTVINNVISGDNNTIINGGIAPPEQLPTPVRNELRRAELQDLPPGAHGPMTPEIYNARSRRLAVYRPRVPSDLTRPRSGDPRFDPPFHATTRTASWKPAAPARPAPTALAMAPASGGLRAPSRSLAPAPNRPAPFKAQPVVARSAPTRRELAALPAPGSKGVSRSRSGLPAARGRAAIPKQPGQTGKFIRPIQPAHASSSRLTPTRSRAPAPAKPPTWRGGAPSRTAPARPGIRRPSLTPAAPPSRSNAGRVYPTGARSRGAPRTPAPPSMNRSVPSRGTPTPRPSAPVPRRYQPPTRLGPRPSAPRFVTPSRPRTPGFAPQPMTVPRTSAPSAARGVPSFAARPRPVSPSRAPAPAARPAPRFVRPAPPRVFTPVRPARGSSFQTAPAPARPATPLRH